MRTLKCPGVRIGGTTVFWWNHPLIACVQYQALLPASMASDMTSRPERSHWGRSYRNETSPYNVNICSDHPNYKRRRGNLDVLKLKTREGFQRLSKNLPLAKLLFV